MAQSTKVPAASFDDLTASPSKWLPPIWIVHSPLWSSGVFPHLVQWLPPLSAAFSTQQSQGAHLTQPRRSHGRPSYLLTCNPLPREDPPQATQSQTSSLCCRESLTSSALWIVHSVSAQKCPPNNFTESAFGKRGGGHLRGTFQSQIKFMFKRFP